MTPENQEARLAKQKAAWDQLQRSNASLLEQFHRLSALNNVHDSPDRVIKEHISLLKKYNELRDTGLVLAQMIADEKQCKVKEVFEEMNYDMQDKV
ncbi:LAME_0F14312g1_1 [Lachancea meyersii CBS 8951]|uniref:LAME_0F14312g1_1 n=1 Tax=Lachancea meyersii CBS 8951 TaxID=1266667 RepID=A0A1G4JXW0_9SACH|nr:LAME_0F14312g1_1 [Lachancea meyersii CBS 8951]